jgi:hypothetical protein
LFAWQFTEKARSHDLDAFDATHPAILIMGSKVGQVSDLPHNRP